MAAPRPVEHGELGTRDPSVVPGSGPRATLPTSLPQCQSSLAASSSQSAVVEITQVAASMAEADQKVSSALRVRRSR
jgi:hypothetical protein